MIYSLPFIAAVIGWFTNFLAVKMLFRPRRKFKFFFIEIQGVFPKRQKIVAEKIGKMVVDELLSAEDIKEKIDHEKNMEVISQNIENKIDDYLQNTLPVNYPVMSLFLGKKIKGRLKNDFMLEVKTLAPEVVEHYMSTIEDSLDIEMIIRQRVSLLSPIKLENLIMSILKKEFRFIEWVGAVIGFLIGLVQVGLIHI